MDAEEVWKAVTQLRAQGEAPTVRKVHQLVGGSFRDIAHHLKTLLPAADVGMVTAETTPAMPRPLGEIAEAQARCREVEAHAQELRSQYQAALARLRALQQAPPPPHQEELSQCTRDVQALAAGLHERERAVQRAEHHLREVKERAATLAHRLPGLRQQLVLAQGEAQAAQQEAARLVEAAQERVAGWAREVQTTQEELTRLLGPETHT
jgi:DNA repair exonuclease SbcCD ATPase subunit